MNRCAYQQMAYKICGEMRVDSIYASDGVVCPKPRRIGVLNPSINDHIRPSRRQFNLQAEVCESKAGSELLDMIIAEGSNGTGKLSLQGSVCSSPPFFCGSPPSRASNPVIQDAQFGNDKVVPLSFAVDASPLPSSSRKNGGVGARVNYGHKPATVRIEGFNCRGISAFA